MDRAGVVLSKEPSALSQERPLATQSEGDVATILLAWQLPLTYRVPPPKASKMR